MSEFLSLELRARNHARSSDPRTSHDAAGRIGEFAHSQCEMILALLKEFGEMSPEDIARRMWSENAINIEAYAVRKRLSDLANSGKAAPTGRDVPTISGRRQRVWGVILQAPNV